MQPLHEIVSELRRRLPTLYSASLNETQTRTIVINPILQCLGWDLRDLQEVVEEYTTIDNKSVDYALKINGRVVVFVEAKPIGDRLNDVRATTQVISYAANEGVPWCVLTNGVIWRVFKADEPGPAPEKLMFEVALEEDPGDPLPIDELVQRLERLSRDAVARGVLGEIGQRVFTDGKVRKILQNVLAEPPRKLTNLILKEDPEGRLSRADVTASLVRIGKELAGQSPVGIETITKPRKRKRKRRSDKRRYNEAHHTQGQPREVVELYKDLDRYCRALAPDDVEVRYLAKYVAYALGPRRTFCSVHLQRRGLRVWLPLSYDSLRDAPPFARDVSGVGHWGIGDLELRLTSSEALEQAKGLIRRAFEMCRRAI